MKHAQYSFAFPDVETTGHDALAYAGASNTGDVLLRPRHEIIDIGCVLADGNTLEIMAEFSVRVNPRHPERCEPYADKINHFISRSQAGEWDTAVSLADALELFFSWLTKCAHGTTPILQGQNFTFDWNFLTAAFAACDIAEEEWGKYFHYSRGDVRSMAVQELWVPETPFDPKDYSLRGGLLQKALNLPPEPMPHRALNGAHQAYRAFKALRELRKNRS